MMGLWDMAIATSNTQRNKSKGLFMMTQFEGL